MMVEDQGDKGRSPAIAGSDHSAEPEPVPVSALRASTPNAVTLSDLDAARPFTTNYGHLKASSVESLQSAFARHRLAENEACAKVAETKAEQAADIALEGSDRSRANESMEAMATSIATAIRARATGAS